MIRPRRMIALGAAIFGAMLLGLGPAAAQLRPFETMQRGVVAYEEGRYQDAVADFTEALKTEGLGPGLEARLYYRRGLALQILKNPSRAVSDYTSAITLDALPADVAAIVHYNRALAFDDLDDVAGALADLDRAIALDPDFAEARNNRGNIYRREGRFEDALADFRASLELDNPMPHLPLFGMGLVYEAMGDKPEAARHFMAALEANPEYAPARDRLERNGGMVFASNGPPVLGRSKAPPESAAAPEEPSEEAGATGGPSLPDTLQIAARPDPSLRLLSQPEGGAAVQDTPIPLPAARPATAPEPAPARSAAISPTGGGPLVQLAAYASEDRALKAWREVFQRKHGDLLDGLEPVVTEVSTDGADPVFRLQVGPLGSRERARALCASLEERGLSCIIRAGN
ncbi:MAG: tetratricopeptide repeat protein [Alphaproteobacteria bacterium]|nr:tetratricopeptide repeat protein [Alphaproteobacteria bacterium]